MVLHFLQQCVLFCQLCNSLFRNSQLLLQHCNSSVTCWNVGFMGIWILCPHKCTWHTRLLCLDTTGALYLVVYNLLTKLLDLSILLVNDLLQFSVDINLFLHFCSILVLNDAATESWAVQLRGPLTLVLLHSFIQSHV